MKSLDEIIEIGISTTDFFKDEVKQVEAGIWEWKKCISINRRKDEVKDSLFKLKCKFAPDFYMMPGINYNGNNWGSGGEPKGLNWCFAYHRMGVPAAMYAQAGERSVALFAKSVTEYGCSAKMYQREDGFYMEIIVPEKEQPDIYCAKNQYEGKGYEKTLSVSDEEREFIVYIVTHKLENKKAIKFDYGFFLRKAWEIFKDDSLYESRFTDIDLWKIGVHYLKQELFFTKQEFYGVCMGLEWNGKKWVQNASRLEIGWVGQNASLAVSLLYDFYFYENQDSLERGLKILDAWSKYAPLKNGLFRCRFDQLMEQENAQNKIEENDAANLYSVVVEYLEAYHILQKIKIDRKIYRRIALRVCDFVCEKQEKNGKIGKSWYNNGKAVDREGGIGCYLVEALLYGWKESKNSKYFQCAIRGFSYYYKEFYEHGYTTAGALDTYCIDKESAMPLLRCAVMLFEICLESEYLEKACYISDYLASWQYHYNVLYSQQTVLEQIRYKTKGGMSVSVQHHHIDCYGLEIYETWMKLWKYTGDLIWKERAEAIWKNALQNISDGKLVIKGQKRPMGSQDEGFLQTRWHTKRGEYFGVSEWLVAWNTAFRLKILREEKMYKRKGGERDYEN